MEWISALRNAINYMEEHLLDDINAQEVSKQVYMSPFYFQKGFQIITGFSVSEYIRNRRLYLAALEIASGHDNIIDIALKYGYTTPESFTKAFSRFHGTTPVQMRREHIAAKIFLPLKISIVIQGGNKMDYTVSTMPGFKVIGFARDFSFENSYREIPLFWNEINEKYSKPAYEGNQPKNEFEKAIIENRIGEYGVCIDNTGSDKTFRYLIAGKYSGGEVPDGMEIYEFPQYEWAKFQCIGPMPSALQTLNTQIFSEWLPNNPDYEIAAGVNIEWYSCDGNITDIDYKSGIWLPVKKK
ncbi:MAG: AraC family transcriptional regulator [Porcipelethomonas sp.]